MLELEYIKEIVQEQVLLEDIKVQIFYRKRDQYQETADSKAYSKWVGDLYETVTGDGLDE